MSFRKHAIAAALVVFSAFASFGAQRTFVASSGNDFNMCTRDLPCRSFAAAIALTDVGGEVVAIDSAGYGPVTITKSVTIVAPLGVHAGISVFTNDGVTINAAALDTVVLRNLYINSQGGANGITLTHAGAVHIEHCVVSGFSNNDINLVPAGPATVEINDTIARQATVGGIYADSADVLTVAVVHCSMQNNRYGLLADRASISVRHSDAEGNTNVSPASGAYGFYARGSGGPAVIGIESSSASNDYVGIYVANGKIVVQNTTAAHDYVGFAAAAPLGGSAKLSIDNSVASANLIGVDIDSAGDASISNSTIADNLNGIQIISGSTARLSRNTITRNQHGIDNASLTPAVVHSAGDNFVDGNGINAVGPITPANKD